jgi:formate hydrogenlyase subunit 5
VTIEDASVVVTTDEFPVAVRDAVAEQGRLAGLFAVPENAGLRLVALVAGQSVVATVATLLSPDESVYPSVTALVSGADWYEREIADLYGLLPLGHPDLDPLVLPLPAGASAPRPGSGEQPEQITPNTDPLPSLVEGEGNFTLPYGPVRSGVFETIEYVVETPGEDIPRVRTRVHYKHRGVDAAFAERSVADGLFLAERVEGVATIAHATAYCEAVERLAEVEISTTAAMIRVVHAELERIANHLDSTIRHTEAAGQAVAYARLTTHKERVMRLRAELCGNRFGRGVLTPGGVREWPKLSGAEILARIGPLENAIRADIRLLMATPSFLDRLRGTGVIPYAVAAAHGALGPLGRGSGIEEDVRATRPYGGYARLGFEPASQDGGDALARQLVRNAEIVSSFHLIRQALDELGHTTSGSALSRPIELSLPVDGVSGEAVGWAEAPQGEVLYLLVLDEGAPVRVKPRSASFHNLGLFTAAFPKDITTDFAFIEASFGLSIAGVAG